MGEGSNPFHIFLVSKEISTLFLTLSVTTTFNCKIQDQLLIKFSYRLFHDVFLNIVNDRKSRNSIDLKNLRRLQKRSTNKRNSKSKRRRNKSNKKTNKSKKRKAMNQISKGKKIEKSKNKMSKKKTTSKSKNSNKESL